MTSKIPFTKEKYLSMQERTRDLNKELSEVMERLKDAREMGDLSENGAYKYAKFEIGRIKRELRNLNHLLEHGEVVNPSSVDTIQFGSFVIIESEGAKQQFQLVSQYESNPLEHKISMDSPIGKTLIGKKAGDEIRVETPKGFVRYTIVATTT